MPAEGARLGHAPSDEHKRIGEYLGGLLGLVHKYARHLPDCHCITGERGHLLLEPFCTCGMEELQAQLRYKAGMFGGGE